MTALRTRRLSDIAEEVNDRIGPRSATPVYAVTKHAGFVPSADYFKKRVHSADISKYKRVKRGEFAYATIHLDEGSVGLLEELDEAAISPMYTVFKVDEREVWQPFLFRLLKSPRMLSKYPALGSGTVHRRKSIPFRRLAELRLELPKVEEQKRIAAILDKADAIRRKRQQAIALTEDLLRSTFLEMFGDPVSNPHGFRVGTLGDLCGDDVKYGTSIKCTSQPTPRSRPVLRIPNVVGGRVNWEDLKHTVLPPAEEASLSLVKGDLLFVRTNGNLEQIGRCAVFQGEREALFASYLIRARIRPDSACDPDYVQSALSMPSFRSVLIGHARTTAGNYNISGSTLKSLQMPIPPPALQRKYHQATRQIACLRDRSLQHLSEANGLLGSLSQRAFRGEL